MESQRILTTYLVHCSPPALLSPSTRQVVHTLLSHSYNPEGLARYLIAQINMEMARLNVQHGYGLVIEDVQTYWSGLLAVPPAAHPETSSTPTHSTPSHSHRHVRHPFHPYAPATARRPSTASSTRLPTASSGSSGAPHANPNVDKLLAEAYNNVTFTWITDFLLYPMSKRVHQLIPRIRGRPSRRKEVTQPQYQHQQQPHAQHQPHHEHQREQHQREAAMNPSTSTSSGISGSHRVRPQQQQQPSATIAAVKVEEGEEGVVASVMSTGASTRPTTAAAPAPEEATSEASASAIVDETASGLEGCKVINFIPHEVYHTPEMVWLASASSQSQGDAESVSLDRYGMMPRTGEAVELDAAANLTGEALELRIGNFREKLRDDLMRRDGPTCAASKRPIPLPTTANPIQPIPQAQQQQLPMAPLVPAPNLQEQEDRRLFVTQIIPESWDTDRFHRFREMVSVFFACQFDALLQSTAPSTSSSAAMDVDVEERELGNYSAGKGSTRRTGHHPLPANLLRSPRNAINLNEQWMRWFDEGRFVILERGGSYYIRCLDPRLVHDPAFSRRGVRPDDPWLPGHGLRLEVGATPLPTASQRRHSKRSHRDVEPSQPSRMPMSLQAILSPPSLPTTAIPTSASYSSHGASTLSYPYHPHNHSHHQPQEPLSAAPFYASSTKVHQLPTPLPTPTSPPPNVLSGDAKLKISVQTRRDHQEQEQPSSSVATYIRTQHSARNGTHQSKAASTSSAIATSSTAATHLRKASHPTSPTTTSTVRKMTASGPFAAGQTARKAYFHTRTTSGASAESSYGSGSGSGSVVSKHSLAAMLNPVSPAESASSRRADYFSEQQRQPQPQMSPVVVPSVETTPVPAPETTIPIRKELWDVDALDPNLVRLHEQIVTTWWATGLAPEVAVQMQWVDTLPLQDMNMYSLGEQMFTNVLKHKLTLL
ncbi:hypothetical protein CPB86DRAFT_801901 [Serendipita vermifera]|nr:hypothetical protein CPB86DRAFT_801901 [Serendipita vermifera]